MERPRLALVNAAHEAEPTRRNFRRELRADLAEFHVVEETYPAGFDYDGLVVTGSKSSVYWDEEWIQPTKEWVGEAIDRDIPALGVCYGHQLLADVLGGTVEDMGSYEIGYRTITHHGGRLYDGVPEEFLSFTTHSDVVTELPPGATLTAENDYGVHGFRKDHVFGIQSHPEYDRETAERVTEGKDLDPERKATVLDAVTEANYQRACAVKQVFDNFVTFITEHRNESAHDRRASIDD